MMTLEQKLQLISSHILFKDLSKEDLMLVVEKATEKIFAPKTVIINQGEDADVLFFIFQGFVRAYTLDEKGNEITLGFCGPNEIIGEMAVIDGGKRSAYVQVMQKTQVVQLTKQAFHELTKNTPTITRHVLKILTYRLRNNVASLEINSSLDLKARTWHILTTLIKYFTTKQIPFSQEELAFIIGCTRPRLTEVLNELQKQGLLTLSYRKVTLI